MRAREVNESAGERKRNDSERRPRAFSCACAWAAVPLRAPFQKKKCYSASFSFQRRRVGDEKKHVIKTQTLFICRRCSRYTTPPEGGMWWRWACLHLLLLAWLFHSHCRRSFLISALHGEREKSARSETTGSSGLLHFFFLS